MKDPNDGFSHKLKFHVILMIQKSMSMEQTPIDVDNESVGCLPYNVDANSSRKNVRMILHFEAYCRALFTRNIRTRFTWKLSKGDGGYQGRTHGAQQQPQSHGQCQICKRCNAGGARQGW